MRMPKLLPRETEYSATVLQWANCMFRLLSGALMDVYVGQDRRHWSLHYNLLCHHSDYFEDHSAKDGKKPNTKVDLPEDDPRAFELLVKWLYQGKIDDVANMSLEKKWEYAEACQKLYVLCDRINLPQLKNHAIDQFRRGCFDAGLVPGPEEMKPIYERTPPSSPFRKLVSRIAARQIMDPEGENDAQMYKMCFESNPDFAVDVINAIKEGAGCKLLEDPTEEIGCVYHVHENGQNCGVA